MFLKYEKTFRILVPQINIKGKHFLSNDEVKSLLGSEVIISEKLDGANTAIIRHKDTFKLQKRGSLVGESEHAQFNLFRAWSYENYEKIMKIPDQTVLYGELMFVHHTIHYDLLPDFFIPFALRNRKNNVYYNRDDMKKLCDEIGFYSAPEITRGVFNKDELFDLIPDKSAFGNEPAEGIVVWNTKHNTRGKVVREEFQKRMDEDGHWIHKKLTLNKLRKNNG